MSRNDIALQQLGLEHKRAAVRRYMAKAQEAFRCRHPRGRVPKAIGGPL